MATKIPRKINFVLPFIHKTGGVAVVFEYARRLRKLGHDVRVYYPLFPYGALYNDIVPWKRLYWRLRYFLSMLLPSRRRAAWFLSPLDLRAVPFVGSLFVRNADAVIATTWPTAYSVAALPKAKGEKFYFIQHYETWTGDVPAIDASFQLDLKRVTIAPWLTELMRAKFHRGVTAEIHNGIDLDFYVPPASKPAGPVSVLMMFHTAAYKGVDDGLAVLERLKRGFPDVKIRLFGMYPFQGPDLGHEYFQDPSPGELLELYRSSHVFLSPSITEGWHLPPMEAMACGCALVATRVGCIPVLEGGGNLLAVEPGDRDGLFRHLESLVLAPELLRETARKGRETMLEYGWEKKGREFESMLFSSIPGL